MRAFGLVLACSLVVASPAAGRADEAGRSHPMVISPERIETVTAKLVERHGQAAQARIRRGLTQVALFWRAEDGSADDFEAFCLDQFVSDPADLDALLARFDANLESVAGHNVALWRELRFPMDVDIGPQLPVDLLFAGLNPFDHFVEDAFRSRVAFVALLNFPLYKAGELLASPPGDRKGWAEARLTQSFTLRVPGEARGLETRAFAAADDYINRYNIHLKVLVDASGNRPFPDGPALISHWGLRDHIKALYVDPKGNLDRQRMIQKVMERIIRQEIPAAVIDSPKTGWDPFANRLVALDGGPIPPADREPDTRYARILDIFNAERAVDAWSPAFPTFIDRKFNAEREIPEKDVEALLVSVLSAPVAKDVAALIRKRLGRPLEPFDIWYDGFKARSSIPEAELNKAVAAKYPDLASFKADLPNVLGRLGFSPETAKFLASRIQVDPARGAGHALGAGMRTDDARLRTRVPKGGMDYKGFNIAMHELGHTVEQTFSLNRVDRVLMAGVPNTAFTEAMAFLFQDRDLDQLGMGRTDAAARAARAVDTFWMTFEIGGVALVDMAMWRYLYAHPDTTPAALREFVVATALDIWNRYYAPVLGVKDSPLLAIYSHMVSSGLYLPDYPIGHLLQFQFERAIEGKNLATEMERMCVQGRLTPEAWMAGAVGGPISARPLVEAAAEGVKVLKKQGGR